MSFSQRLFPLTLKAAAAATGSDEGVTDSQREQQMAVAARDKDKDKDKLYRDRVRGSVGLIMIDARVPRENPYR
jgi:hypothetical protein